MMESIKESFNFTSVLNELSLLLIKILLILSKGLISLLDKFFHFSCFYLYISLILTFIYKTKYYIHIKNI